MGTRTTGGTGERWTIGADEHRLLRAAPGLLAACRAAYDMVRNCPGNWQTQVADMLGAAIVAAEKGNVSAS